MQYMRHPVFYLLLLAFCSPADAAMPYPYAELDSTIRHYRRGEMDKAFKGFKELAENGDVVSQYYLALLYSEGDERFRNPEQALEWYEKAATNGHAGAQGGLGEMYLRGRGVPRNPALARFWLQKAASRGVTSAQRNLGELYLASDPGDYRKVLFWMEQAAAKNDPLDQFALASLYEWEPAIKDAKKAAFWWRKAANNGVADAQYRLGVRHGAGSGMPKDHAKALYWLKKADAQGHREAPYSIAIMYGHGRGVPQDLGEASRWMCKAAKRKNRNAVYELRNGDIECLKQVAQQGYALAQYELGRQLENPAGTTHDYANAAIWYRKAAEQQESGAFFALGDLYALGLGVRQDAVLAKMLYLLDGEGEYGRSHSSRIQSPLSGEQIDKARRLAKEWKSGTPLPEMGEPSH